MIGCLIVFALAYFWLLLETDFLRVRLICGKIPAKISIKLLPSPKPVLLLPIGITRPKAARYQVFNCLRPSKNLDPIHEGSNIPEDKEKDFEVTTYQIYLSPGIEPMCGYEWLDKHCADVLDFQQSIEMNLGNVRYTMTIKKPEVIKDIMRVNKLSKSEKSKLQSLNPLLDYGNKVIRRKCKKIVVANP